MNHNDHMYGNIGAMLTLALSPLLVGAAPTLTSIVDALTASLAAYVYLGLGVALTVFIWGVLQFIRGAGDDKEISAGRKRMIWGVVGLFLIVSVWGIVAIARMLLGIPTTPNCVNTGFTVGTNGSLTARECN